MLKCPDCSIEFPLTCQAYLTAGKGFYTCPNCLAECRLELPGWLKTLERLILIPGVIVCALIGVRTRFLYGVGLSILWLGINTPLNLFLDGKFGWLVLIRSRKKAEPPPPPPLPTPTGQPSEALTTILNGANDEGTLFALYEQISGVGAVNAAQQLFVAAWELSAFIASDGFEYLYDQGEPMEIWLQVFLDIGCPEVKPAFDRALEIAPNELMQDDQKLHEHLIANFEPLKECLNLYLDLSQHLLPCMAQFVRDHRQDFARKP